LEKANIIDKKLNITIREAEKEDFDFVIELIHKALSPYYGGDHRAHAQRIFSTHISGGKDQIGHFSFEQKMFIITKGNISAGLIHIVGKRQGTFKISPIIVVPKYRGKYGLGKRLLELAENYAKNKGARQIYCTVAMENNGAIQFFIRNGYIIAGHSDSHYKVGITEVMLYKLFLRSDFDEMFDRPNISVHPMKDIHESQVRKLLLNALPKDFGGIDSKWVDALFNGYKRRNSGDINLKFKLIYVAVNRDNIISGVAGATPKKGEPIKIMPLVATNLLSFMALLTDVPYQLKPYGRKLYIHITPSVEETIALQRRGWKLDAVLPAGYHKDRVTQQWSFDIISEDFMRSIRTKKTYLNAIKKGEKTLEVRVSYEGIKNIQQGERIKFCSHADTVVTRINNIRRYPTFTSMLEYEDPKRIVPSKDKSEILKILQDIYPPKLEKLGVIILEIQVEDRHSKK
jgi:ASC-1-like (ASCH) protein/GNAT superfamily N-acetyltransferase